MTPSPTKAKVHRDVAAVVTNSSAWDYDEATRRTTPLENRHPVTCPLALPFPRGAKAKAAVLARGREAATLRDGLDDSIRARTEAPGPCPPASPWRGTFACRRCPRPRAPP
eukprot:scaffold52912_cov73-Phaeocystis_antarctica.AAC.2